MIFIARNGELINRLNDKMSLTSSKIKRIDIHKKDEALQIDIYLELLYNKDQNNLMLRFIGIESFFFLYQSDYFFYNVEIVKFFHTNSNQIYISFDPINENEIVDSDDVDYIISAEVEGYFI